MLKLNIISVTLVVFLALQFSPENVNGHGSSSRSTPTPNNHDDQWPGAGEQHYGQGGNNDNSEENYDRKPSSSSQSSGSYKEAGKSNNFAREKHIERYGFPDNCVKDPDFRNKCNYFVEIIKEENDPEHLHFELSRHLDRDKASGYIALGLSKDKKMGEDHIVECIKLGNGDTANYQSWSKSRTKPTRLGTDNKVIIMKDHSKYEDGSLTCKFRRPIITRVTIPDTRRTEKFDLERGEYHVLLASGGLDGNEDSDTLGYHERGYNTFVSEDFLGHLNDHYISGKDKHGSPTYYNKNGGGHHAITVLSIICFALLSYLLL